MSSSASPEDPASGAPGTAPREPGPESPRGPSGPEHVDWLGLPEPVRERLAELTAAAVGRLAVTDVPRQLRPVARFAPAKRARLGGPALLSGLRDSARFRTAVLEWLREHRVDALDPNDDDSVAAAAAAVLLGESSASSRVRLVAKNAEETTLRAERDAALARSRRLESEVTRLKDEVERLQRSVADARTEREDELVRLRGRLREQGVVLRRAKDAAEEAVAAKAHAETDRDARLRALEERLDRERQRVAAERVRADRAAADAEAARQSAREARDADEVRLSLLLDTVSGAVDGLRRELSLGSGARRPADLVAGASAGRRGGRVGEPSALDTLLALPNVHVVVDGYNVTKTGYPELSLAEQRARLVRQLGALAARLRAEITVVFDGADVTAIPQAGPRQVRVLFSDPGVLADDVIKTMVRSEPQGRPVLVVTSDQAVVAAVVAAGAHAAPSSVLLTRLGRV